MTEHTTLTPIETLPPLAVTATAALTSTIDDDWLKRVIVRVRCTVDVCLKFSEDPAVDAVATTDDMELAANQHEYFDVCVGTKISAVRAASAVGNGVLKVTICAKR